MRVPRGVADVDVDVAEARHVPAARSCRGAPATASGTARRDARPRAAGRGNAPPGSPSRRRSSRRARGPRARSTPRGRRATAGRPWAASRGKCRSTRMFRVMRAPCQRNASAPRRASQSTPSRAPSCASARAGTGEWPPDALSWTLAIPQLRREEDPAAPEALAQDAIPRVPAEAGRADVYDRELRVQLAGAQVELTMVPAHRHVQAEDERRRVRQAARVGEPAERDVAGVRVDCGARVDAGAVRVALLALAGERVVDALRRPRSSRRRSRPTTSGWRGRSSPRDHTDSSRWVGSSSSSQRMMAYCRASWSNREPRWRHSWPSGSNVPPSGM